MAISSGLAMIPFCSFGYFGLKNGISLVTDHEREEKRKSLKYSGNINLWIGSPWREKK
jgi:hypothetical protein